MAFLLSLGLFAVLMVAITYFGYRRYARPARVYEQLGGEATLTMPSLDKISEADPGLAVWVVQQVGEKVPLDPEGAAALLRNNLWIYGFGGIVIPFIGIKLIDMVITRIGLA